MHKSLEVDGGGSTNLPHLLQRRLSSQNDTTETNLFQELYTLDTGIVTLRACVQLNRREVAFQKPQILDDQGVNAYVVKAVYHLYGIIQLIIEQNGVYCSKYLCAI